MKRTLFSPCATLFACAIAAHAAATPLWCEEGAAVFGGATSGVSRVASPLVSVTPVGDPVGQWENGVFSVCAHTPAPVEYRWTLLPDDCLDWLVPEASGDAHLSVVDPFLLGLFPTMNGGPASGALSFRNFDPTGAHSRLWGPLSAPVASHPCAAGTTALCLSCGRRHGSGESCFHADDCASRTNLAAACTCPPPFVRIGDELALRLAGEEGCCCASGGWSPDLVSASPALGASVSNDWIVLAPTDRSSTLGGHSAQYQVLDTTGGVYRALTLRATAAGLGIEPDLSEAPAWALGGKTALQHFVTNGTLCLARRPEPYPVRVWNRSPSDARLVFDFQSDPGGPRLRIAPAGDPFSSMSVTNAAFAEPDADLMVWIDASGTNGTATLSLTLSDPASDRTLLADALVIRIADCSPGEHWRLRSASERIEWDCSGLPEPVWIGIGHAGADGVLTNTLEYAASHRPSLSLDLAPGDYDLEAYYPRVYAGAQSGWGVPGALHVRAPLQLDRENIGLLRGSDQKLSIRVDNGGFDETFVWLVHSPDPFEPDLQVRLYETVDALNGSSFILAGTNVWIAAGSRVGQRELVVRDETPLGRIASAPLEVIDFSIVPERARVRTGGAPQCVFRTEPSNAVASAWTIEPGPALLAASASPTSWTNALGSATDVWVLPGDVTNRSTVRAVHPLYTNVVAEARLESIDFRLEPVTVRTVQGTNANPASVVLAESAPFACDVEPAGWVPDSAIHWTPSSADVAVSGTGRTVRVTPSSTGLHSLSVEIDDYIGETPTIAFRCFPEWSDVPCHFVFVTDESGNLPQGVTNKTAFAEAWLSGANAIFAQAGMRLFVSATEEATNSTQSFRINAAQLDAGADELLNLYQLFPQESGIKVFVIDAMVNVNEEPVVFAFTASADTNFGRSSFGIVIPAYMNTADFAHEIGHACGLQDIYVSSAESALSLPGPSLSVSGKALQVHAPNDWTGSVSFYSLDFSRVELLRRLLMYGVSEEGLRHTDITSGRIHGISSDWTFSTYSDQMTLVGLEDMNRSPFTLGSNNLQ